MSIVDFPQQGTIGTSLMPKRYDIVLYQGDTFAFNLVLKDGSAALVDVTGWTAEGQIKKVTDNAAAETPALTVTTGTTDGLISVKISDTGTSALSGDTDYKYDIQLTDTGGNVRTIIGGTLTVTEDITE